CSLPWLILCPYTPLFGSRRDVGEPGVATGRLAHPEGQAAGRRHDELVGSALPLRHVDPALRHVAATSLRQIDPTTPLRRPCPAPRRCARSTPPGVMSQDLDPAGFGSENVH